MFPVLISLDSNEGRKDFFKSVTYQYETDAQVCSGLDPVYTRTFKTDFFLFLALYSCEEVTPRHYGFWILTSQSTIWMCGFGEQKVIFLGSLTFRDLRNFFRTAIRGSLYLYRKKGLCAIPHFFLHSPSSIFFVVLSSTVFLLFIFHANSIKE